VVEGAAVEATSELNDELNEAAVTELMAESKLVSEEAAEATAELA
jgi:hypothetical protein